MVFSSKAMTSGFEFEQAPERIRAAADWLCRSQDVTGGGGSSAYYSPLFGWAPPYPETTGYILPTLWRCADFLANPEYGRRAERMALWLLDLQSPEGWFPGGTWRPNGKHTPSVFNTAQILFGLTEADARTGNQAFRDAAARAAQWLASQQQEDGRWTAGAYVQGYTSPSYYAHVCWPLALYWRCHGGDDIRQCVLRGLAAVLADRMPDGSFRNWSFAPGKRAFTHTIGYTLQGLVESALILGEWEPYGAAAAASAEKLLRKAESAGRLAGAYGPAWEPSERFICLTGHCQLASTWLRLHEKTGDARFLNVAAKAVDEVCRHQRLGTHRRNLDGAIAGSKPFFGPYMRLRYPNWAAKFFIDALFHLLAALAALNTGGDTAS
jgi:hypothetical protein